VRPRWARPKPPAASCSAGRVKTSRRASGFWKRPRDEHRRLLLAFVRAVNEGRHEELLELLAEDALLIADAGPSGGRYGKIRNVGKPLAGRQRIVTLMKAFAAQDVSPRLTIQERTLNGHPAVIALQGEEVVAAILISVADGKIQHVFLQNDRTRLRHVGAG
jgi:RNA polymerase sigma-70 factor, ECF subfamily